MKITEKQADMQAPRERILHTAHDLFYREGIRATGIDRIIAESSVSKVTFYRQFASKNELVLAYLQFRHELWIGWFHDTLLRHVSASKLKADALVGVMREWFENPAFRGCAFINMIAEFDGALPEGVEIVRSHKIEMTREIEAILRKSPKRKSDAFAIALALDGAIVHAQYEADTETVLVSLGHVLHCMNLD